MKAAGRKKAMDRQKPRKGILPRVIATAAALALAVACCLYVNNIIGYLPLLCIVFCVVISFVHVRVLAHYLDVDDHAASLDCPRGDDVDFKMGFRNRCVLPFARVQPHFYVTNIDGGVGSVFDPSIALAPLEKVDYSFSVRFGHIGTYQVGMNSIDIYDYLGLFSKRLHCDRTYGVNVMPHVYPISKLSNYSVSAKESQNMFLPVVTDDMDYAGVREYVRGDPLKSIHWKLSARTGTYYTRLFEAFGTPGISIYIDFSAPVLGEEQLMDAFDCVVEAAFSISQYAADNGMDYEIGFTSRAGDDIRYTSITSDDFSDAVREMPSLSHDIDSSIIVEALVKETRSLYSYENIAVCSANVTDELVATVLESKYHERNPILVAAIPKDSDEQQAKKCRMRLRKLASADVPYYIIGSADELLGGES